MIGMEAVATFLAVEPTVVNPLFTAGKADLAIDLIERFLRDFPIYKITIYKNIIWVLL